MLRMKHVTLLLVMAIVFIGCATVKPNFVDPMGRTLPDKHYTLQVVGKPLFISFYYTAWEEVKDLDGSKIGNPTYLDFFKPNEINKKKVKAITMTVEVNNPTGLEYGLYQKMDLRIGQGNVNIKEVQTGGEVNRSNLPYRQFVYRLPIGKNIHEVEQLVKVYLENTEVARLGSFTYKLF